MQQLPRRRLLKSGLTALAAAATWDVTQPWDAVQAQSPAIEPPLATRGVVLTPEDFTLGDWPQRAKAAGLSTIGIHHQNSPRAVIDWIRSDAGQSFLAEAAKWELAVEYELHAMKELLPRDLFTRHPQMFRMDDAGQRTPNSNCCASSPEALDKIASSAVEIAQSLRPTTGRYFYWGDDGEPWCRCDKCRELSPSEQALLIENQIVAALRQTTDAKAQLAHLAYTNTLAPPRNVKPAEGVFLEYAPIYRRYDVPYEEQRLASDRDGLAALDANLEVFPRQTAQALEYWLDVSRFSQWRRPAVKLPWRREVFLADLKAYRKRGIRHITSFAVYVDAEYLRRHGEPEFLREYGSGLTAPR